jgi:predicted nucleotidyltransferase
MNLGAPLLDVVPGARGALLRTLVRLERPVSRRQLALAAGVAPGHASTVVQELIDAGLVHETVAGRSSMVILNRHHLAARPLVALAGLRGELVRRLRTRLAEWHDLEGAWLFGSVARGDAGADADIDLLVIARDLGSPGLHERLSVLQVDISTWTGNEVQVVEHSRASWRALIETRSPFVEQVRRDGVQLSADGAELLERPR